MDLLGITFVALHRHCFKPNLYMTKTTNDASKRMESTTSEPTEQTERSYAVYTTKDLAFDPLKDLNLPNSYDEVETRLKKLQGERAPEILN